MLEKSYGRDSRFYIQQVISVSFFESFNELILI